MASHPRRQQST